MRPSSKRVHPVQSLRAATRAAVFLLEVLPSMPSGLLDRVTRAPVVERVSYPGSDGEMETELYRPRGLGPFPGVVVCLGVVSFGVDHPQVPRLGRALARSGFAALFHWSTAMRDLRLEPRDAVGIALAYDWLTGQPNIDAVRSGLIGTCVGGSFALLAAADPEIRARIGFVVAWAPFASMWSLGRDIASATTERHGQRTDWEVDQLARKVFVRSLTSVLESSEANELRGRCAERGTLPDDLNLSADGRAMLPLLSALDVAEADAALRQLPRHIKQQFDAMSPIERLSEIEAPLIVIAHDRDDAVIPPGESRMLRRALEGRTGVHYTEFTMFKHLDPTKVRLPMLALVRELLKFYRCVYPLFRQSTND